QGLDLDRRFRLVADPCVSDLELHLDTVLVELDRANTAYLDTGDPHGVVLRQSGSLAELGRIDGPRADDRQLFGVQRGRDFERDHHESSYSVRNRLALLEGLHAPHLPLVTGSSGRSGVSVLNRSFKLQAKKLSHEP